MATAAITAERLGKKYRLGTHIGGYGRLTESIYEAIRTPFHRIRHGSRPHNGELWAVRDVSLEVAEGEVLGIVGRNGAGKSTLLKILARITEPTEGHAELRGRVGSLLDVGTGFHPELTGRENVYLNGAILGLRRVEIERRFDEIVDFAEVERFIDTPVKRYSSGMYLRLAFAVAAHLEPEILIVDEVLAVGDAAFQKKCLRKISSGAGEGRTVVFVSHNMQAVKILCDRAVHIEGGTIVNEGATDRVVESYLTAQDELTWEKFWADPARRPGDEHCRLVSVRVLDSDARPTSLFSSSDEIQLELEVDVEEPHPALCIGFDLSTADGVPVFRSYQTDVPEDERPVVTQGRNVLRCTVSGGLLNAGRYFVQPRISLHSLKWIVQSEAAVHFDVLFAHGDSEFLKAGSRPGIVAPILSWDTAD
jgi:lipopolysaccharide transport system ATP-binding protein